MELCVLIPCFNDLKGLLYAVQSIVYPGGGCLILIVDDGSDQPLQEEWVTAHTSLPVKIIRLESNKGITEALNTGLRWIHTERNISFVARLDCNDINHSERLTSQVEFLRLNPSVDLLGSWCLFQNQSATKKFIYKTPLQHINILKEMTFRNVFIHPTVMFRASLIDVIGFYPTEYPYAEDYAYFWTILNYTQGSVLNEVLVTSRINERGISVANRRKQLLSRMKVVRKFERNWWRKAAGLIKLQSLILIPYRFVELWKQSRA